MFLLTLFSSHYVVKDGVADAVRRITQPIPVSNMHLASNIISIEPDSTPSSTVKIQFTSKTDSLESIAGFQHVIIATQANQAVPLLSTLQSSYLEDSPSARATEAQIECLKQFKYVPTIVVNHTDTTFLPERERDQRDLNLVVGTKGQNGFTSEKIMSKNSPCLHSGYSMATQLIRSPSSSQSPCPSPSSNPNFIMQTTDPIHPPAPSSIISISRIERAVLTAGSKTAQRDLMTVGSGRWVFNWRGFSSTHWRPITADYHRPHSLGRLQGPAVTPRTRRAAVPPSSLSNGSGAGPDDTSESEQEGGGPGIWLCGSYAHPGIPLLEACVTSALNVVENGVFAVEGVDVKAEWAIR